jgi:hypothetical protein
LVCRWRAARRRSKRSYSRASAPLRTTCRAQKDRSGGQLIFLISRRSF